MTGYGSPIHEVRIRAAHLPLLQMQRGKLNDLRDDAKQWCAAYRQDLLEDYRLLRPYLPGTCKDFLDVGGGMSGLGILISRYYQWGRGGTKAYILDGERCDHIDPSLEHDHDEPFNDAQLLTDFWLMNGVQPPVLVPPEQPNLIPRDVFFDLVISTQAWCFHFEPDAYLEEITEHTHARTWMMIDVRKNKPDYLDQLQRHWTLDKVLRETDKYLRALWHPHRSARL